jgi:ATP-dependent RNA helicase DDX24/MAK5
MSSRQHTHLTELSQLRFLVIDEADRMVQQGSFPQLIRIFDAIHHANPMDSNDKEEQIESDDENEDENDRLLSLPGIPGEAKVTMLNDVLLERMQRQQNGDCSFSAVEPMEMDEDEFAQQLPKENQIDDKDDDISLPPPPPVSRQTFVFSATLTLPPSSSYVASKKVNKKTNKKNKSKKQDTVEGAIAEILEKARAKGQTKVVDLTTPDKHSVLALTMNGPAVASSSSTASSSLSSSRLPPGLSLRKIECTQRHKDSHLYAYLVTTAQGASGPCLVFCNSIAAVRRVGATLEALRLPVRMLHANMAQVSVEKFFHLFSLVAVRSKLLEYIPEHCSRLFLVVLSK